MQENICIAQSILQMRRNLATLTGATCSNRCTGSAHYRYGGIAHAGLFASYTRKLRRIQNSCMRFIHAVLPRESVAPLYPQTNSLQISKRQTWLLLVLFYKTVVRGDGPDYISERFTRMVDIHSYSTRNRVSSFVTPIPRTRIMAGSFQVVAVKVWNAVPPTLYILSLIHI